MIDIKAMVRELDEKIEYHRGSGEYPDHGFVEVVIELTDEHREAFIQAKCKGQDEEPLFTPKGREYGFGYRVGRDGREYGYVQHYVFLPTMPLRVEVAGFWHFLYQMEMEGYRRHGQDSLIKDFSEWVEDFIGDTYGATGPDFLKEVRGIYNKLVKSENERE